MSDGRKRRLGGMELCLRSWRTGGGFGSGVESFGGRDFHCMRLGMRRGRSVGGNFGECWSMRIVGLRRRWLG